MSSLSLAKASSGCFVLALIAGYGCDARIEKFAPNRVFSLALATSRDIPTESAQKDVSSTLDQVFGTLNDPKWPSELLTGSSAQNFVDLERLRRAAGPVSSGKSGVHLGLYREHCVVCHALEGSGTGPASQFQDPYPRDFRHGVFKWKSTQRGSKPTRDDLRDLLVRGVPGTGMPSFSLLAPDDLDALVDYVIYLSVRGETERRLLSGAVDEFDYGAEPPQASLRILQDSDSDGGQYVQQTVRRVAEHWLAAEQQVVSIPSEPILSANELQASIERGRKLFHGAIANCVGCHGAEGTGQLPTLDYDDWTKDYTTRIGLTPDDRAAVQPFRDVGALRPKPIRPRNLQDGVFRGGGGSSELFCRITQGIAGTPMPAVAVVDQQSGLGLTYAQVWDLVRYVQSLAP